MTQGMWRIPCSACADVSWLGYVASLDFRHRSISSPCVRRMIFFPLIAPNCMSRQNHCKEPAMTQSCAWQRLKTRIGSLVSSNFEEPRAFRDLIRMILRLSLYNGSSPLHQIRTLFPHFLVMSTPPNTASLRWRGLSLVGGGFIVKRRLSLCTPYITPVSTSLARWLSNQSCSN